MIKDIFILKYNFLITHEKSMNLFVLKMYEHKIISNNICWQLHNWSNHITDMPEGWMIPKREAASQYGKHNEILQSAQRNSSMAHSLRYYLYLENL